MKEAEERTLKVTLILKSNQSITFDCKSFDYYRTPKQNTLKDFTVTDPDESYPVYLDMNEVAAVVVKKIVGATGFGGGSGKRLGF